MTRVRVILFDLGDTVWHHPRRPPPAEVDAELVRRLEAVLARRGLRPRMGAAEIQVVLAERAAALEARAAREGGGDYLAMTTTVLHEAGLSPSPDMAEEVWETRRLGGRFLRRVILPGAHETLAALKKRGFRLGVVTNRAHGGASFRVELEEYGLSDYFEALISSDRVGYRKPHAAIFRAALEEFGVAAGEALHVGDDLEADIEGARAVGMTPVWMRGVRSMKAGRVEDAPRSIEVIDHLSQLLVLPCLMTPLP